MLLSSSCCLWVLSNLLLFSLFPLFHLSLPSCAVQYQSEGSRPHLSKLDLEQWYQELMAGSSQLCPPSLPAKSFSGRRPLLQVQGLSSSFLLIFPHSFFCYICVCVMLILCQPSACFISHPRSVCDVRETEKNLLLFSVKRSSYLNPHKNY